MANEHKDSRLLHKVFVYILSGVSSVLGYVAWIQKARVEDAKEREIKLELVANKKDAQIDSLQKLLLIRTDKSFEELKNILDINGKNGTITIKPKESDYEVQKHTNSRAVEHGN